MDSIHRLGFPFSFLLLPLLQSLFPFSISSSPQLHLLQLSPQSPQNLQTFPSTAIPAFTKPSPPPPPPPPPPPAASTASDSDNGNIAAAVIGTAASSFALYGFLFFAFHRFRKQKRRGQHNSTVAASGEGAGGDANALRSKTEPTVNGVIVDDNMAYWRKCDHCNSIVDGEETPEPLRRRRGKGELMTQETPLLPSDSVNSTSKVFSQSRASDRNSSTSIASIDSVPPPAPPPPPPTPPAPPPPPPPPRRKAAAPPAEVRPDSGMERPRLKPLHWEKVTPTRAGHSMVWDRINDGSIKFDDDQMEALFGYISTNQPPSNSNSGDSSTSTSDGGAAPTPTQIHLLDARKSQNIAIILRTLTQTRHQILQSLHSGRHTLSPDTLEKLSRITLSKEEQSLFLSADPLRLPDAESFLFHLLHSSPSAFPRIEAMHFRACVYTPETLLLKQSTQTLELACKELRTRGLFLKLLEAILKAGNRMNAGTARGNAQAFDLAALRKLSDVKSSDGKSTLLHFVVEEVARSEGKRRAAATYEEEERESEFVALGLPVVERLSFEFVNVKKAAAIEPDAMDAACFAMAERVADIREFLRGCEEEEGFVREMKGFVERAGKEIEEVREEQRRVMEIVRRTTEYYQLGAKGKEKEKEKEGKASLRIFVIVSDFLGMVDQACVDISRNVQKRKKKQTPLEKEKRIATRFPNLPARFMADNSVSCSDSEEEF